MRFRITLAVFAGSIFCNPAILPAQDFLKQLEETILKRQGESKTKETAETAAPPETSTEGGVTLGEPENEDLPLPRATSNDNAPMLLSPPSSNPNGDVLPAPKGTVAKPTSPKPTSPRPADSNAASSKTGSRSLLAPSSNQPVPPPRPAPPKASVVSSAPKIVAGGGGYLGMTVESTAGGGFGLTVAQVTIDSPAWKAGFRTGDRLIGVDGTAVSTVEDFAVQLGQYSPGTPIRFLIDRKGRNMTLTGVLMDRGLANRVHGNVPGAIPYQPVGNIDEGPAYFGVDVSDMSDEFRKQFGIPAYRGASVTEVIKGSPADQAGLKPGDCVTSFKGREVRSAEDVFSGIVESKPGELIEFSYYRGAVLNRASTILISKSAEPGDMQMAGPANGITPDMLTPEYVSALHSELDRVSEELHSTQERLQQLEARLKQIETRR